MVKFYGVGITGIAGPGGGTDEKPVGTVYISVANEDSSETQRFNFEGNREEIKQQSTDQALEMLLNLHNTR